MAPESSTSKKQKVVDIMGPIHKIGPVISDLYQDHLGKLVMSLSKKLSTATSWEDFIKTHWGKSYLAPDINDIQHSARGLLQNFQDQGISVPMDDPPWASDTIDQCAQRGPLPSANLHHDFLQTEMADFINASFWVMLPLEQVRSLGKDFRLSLVAVKEEVNRCPWVIVDHTWFGINGHTMGELPSEVMHQNMPK